MLDFFKGEELVVVDAGTTAKSHRLRNGDIVAVYRDTSIDGSPKDKIRVVMDSTWRYVELGEVDWKWCRTGHSTQGIEVDVGIIAVVPSPVTTRRWLYTAVSRCRKKCILVYSRDGLLDCLAKDPERRTLLPTFLDRALATATALNQPGNGK